MSLLSSAAPAKRRAARAFVLLALGAAACGEPSGPAPKPTAIALTSSQPTTGTAGLALSSGITFEVKDQNGAAMADVPVTITASGGGTVTGAPTATAAGTTSIGTWTLAPSAGVNSLTIAVEGLTPLVIDVQGTAGPAAALGVISGNNQSGLAGRALAQPVAFSVTDQFGNPVPGGAVTVTVGGGGSASQVVTNAQGLATTTWTLGKSAVPQSLIATSGSYTATAGATVATGYKVEVRFVGPTMSAGVQRAFTAAAARLMGMITGDLQNVLADSIDLATSCGNPALPTVDEIVDDLVIYASAPDLDGPGGLLGQAGPCLVRSIGSELPVYGTMEFDSADLARMEADGTLTSVILHEMMHVVGIGVYWNFAGLLQDPDLSTVRFTGALATAQCRLEGGTSICSSAVPVEDQGGDGTRNSHWRESIFDTEIMTGWENSPIVNGVALPAPISRMTVGSLQDIGYDINLDAGDAYRIPGTGLRATTGSAALRKWEGKIRTPRGRIDPTTGRVTPIAQR